MGKIFNKKIGLLLIVLFQLNQFSALFGRTVRVGYYQSSGNFMSGESEADPKSGYAYEYLQALSAYTGWTYEFKYGLWPDLWQALLNGEIDILPDVSYLSSRTEKINYPLLPSGKESYYIFSKQSRSEIRDDDISSLNGLKIGIAKGTYQQVLFNRWIKSAQIKLNVVEYVDDDEGFKLLDDGKIDLLLEIDIDVLPELHWKPIYKIGEADIYLGVNKNQPEILKELNEGQEELFHINPYFSQILWAKYFSKVNSEYELTEREKDWFQNHEKIRIGFIKDDAPFAVLKSENKAGGLISDIVREILFKTGSDESAVKYYGYDDFEAMFSALKNKEIDAIFPLTRELNFADNEKIILSDNVISVPMVIAYKNDEQALLMKKLGIGNGNKASLYLRTFYPECEDFVTCNEKDGLDGVLDGFYYGYMCNAYKMQRAIDTDQKYDKLKSITLPYDCELSFAACPENAAFISTVNKVLACLSETEINNYLASHFSEEKQTGIAYYFNRYLSLIVSIIITSFIVILLLVTGLFVSVKKLREYFNYDVLTHLFNRRLFNSYMEKALKKAEEKNQGFAIILFDLDDFKHINDTYGHECGDVVLKTVSANIRSGIKPEDYAFRWGGEEFVILAETSKEVAVRIAERIRKAVEQTVIHYNDSIVGITVTAGIAAWEKGKNEKDIFIEADEKLYKGKNGGKNQVIS